MLKSSSRRLFSRHTRVPQHVPNIFEKDGNFRLPDGCFSSMLNFHTAKKVPGEAHKKVPDNILLLRGQRISGIISPSSACLHPAQAKKGNARLQKPMGVFPAC
jgi:hypothetical protein